MTTATADPDSPTERRVATRRQPALGTVCRLRLDPDDDPALGLVWNISASGVSMLLPTPHTPGGLIPGELETMTRGESLSVRLRVVHVRKLETGDFIMGAQFDRPLSEAEMAPFVT